MKAPGHHNYEVSALDEIISSASDDATSASNLVRKVLVVARRLEAVDVAAWADNELSGYPNSADLPKYRGPWTVNVTGEWAAPGMRDQQLVGRGGMTDPSLDPLFEVALHDSLDGVETLARSGKQMAVPWDPAMVGLWNTFIDQQKVPHMLGWHLLSAQRLIAPGLLQTVLGGVRTAVLRLALDLQAIAPDAGATNGPTVAESPVAQTVNNFTTNVYGGNPTVAQGQSNTQNLNIAIGDLGALRDAAASLGLDESGLAALTDAVQAPAGERASRVQAFLGAVRAGAFGVAVGAAGDLAATGLEALIAQFFG
jgi:hypothetical protein